MTSENAAEMAELSSITPLRRTRRTESQLHKTPEISAAVRADAKQMTQLLTDVRLDYELLRVYANAASM